MPNEHAVQWYSEPKTGHVEIEPEPRWQSDERYPYREHGLQISLEYACTIITIQRSLKLLRPGNRRTSWNPHFDYQILTVARPHALAVHRIAALTLQHICLTTETKHIIERHSRAYDSRLPAPPEQDRCYARETHGCSLQPTEQLDQSGELACHRITGGRLLRDYTPTPDTLRSIFEDLIAFSKSL